MNFERCAVGRTARAFARVLYFVAVFACGKERDFNDPESSGGIEPGAVQPSPAGTNRSTPIGASSAGGGTDGDASRSGETGMPSSSEAIPAESVPAGVPLTPMRADSGVSESAAPQAPEGPMDGNETTACEGECQVLVDGSCTPIGNNEVCDDDGRPGRCITPGQCVELCQLDVSNFDCLLQ